MADTSIIFHGAETRSNVLDLMRKSSVFVAPYIQEPFGIAPVEALVSGAIPIVTDMGGLKDNFSDIEADMISGNAIVMGNNYSEFTEKISLDLLQRNLVNAARRAYGIVGEKIGSIAGGLIINNGRNQAKTGRWSIERCVDNYVDIYRGN